jgi:two-component system, sensor histidine kinase
MFLNMQYSDEMNILVAEDNPINQQIMEVILRLKQWNCTIVNNGKEAVEATQNNSYDLIFMDLNMPVLDGIEATKIIRGQNKLTPIVAITAYHDDYYREKTKEVGMNGFIPKPFSRRDIYEAVSLLAENGN